MAQINHCVKCGQELNANGAIVISPPIPNGKIEELGDFQKFHICKECYTWLYNFIFNIPSYAAIGKPCCFCGLVMEDEVDIEERSYYPVCRNANCIQKKWITRNA